MGPRKFVAFLLFAAVLACGERPDDGRLRVAVSIVPQAWLVDAIGGPHTDVTVLVGPGESPATYQPSDLEVTEVMRARVYFRIGVPFENGKWLAAIAGSTDVRIVDVRAGIDLREMEGHEGHGHGLEDRDPHVWLAPGPLEVQARTVAHTLADLDPANAENYLANLESVLEELDRVDAEIRKMLEPHRGRRLYVFHPSWGYFCDAYGLRQSPIEIEGKEPSEAELTDLVRMARKDRAKAVFHQEQITGQSARALAEAVGADLVPLDPLARDVPENLLRIARTVAEALR
ncbi:MAG: metal ABC transporter solute-binding protein, Zn/Mn family [Planctomycetota bacterium]|jgi:zinc transport system substrate-binding protein